MVTVQQKLITAEEFMNLPEPVDGSQQELIRGVIVTMPPPKGLHAICCNKVGRRVGNFVEDHRLGWVTSNDAGFISERDPDSVRGPDIAFWSITRVPRPPQGYFEVPPDLAIEIVSPSDTFSRTTEKIRHYLGNGVPVVWYVDPELRIVTIYRPDNSMQTLEETDTLEGGELLPGFSCRVAELFP
jgi:Uma2 family endonuclease